MTKHTTFRLTTLASLALYAGFIAAPTATAQSVIEVLSEDKADQMLLQDGTGTTVGTLSVSDITLPWGLRNARETFQSVRYLARTNQEPSAGSIKIPMRSYYARCKNHDGVDSVFVSMTLQDGDSIDDNVGSVFELRYDDESGLFKRNGNERKLSGFCRQTHGIAVSKRCNRVAVLCQTDPFESQRRTPTKDLVELYGDSIMKEDADNYDEVGSDVARRKANPEIWLLEWQNTPLSGSYRSYVASKQAGGAGGKSALNLLHVERDSQGRSSYAFSSNTRVFDSGGGSHHAGALYVIDRDNWRYDLYDSGSGGGRGWSFDCVAGHILTMRTVYNPYAEQYSALCTSDNSRNLGGEDPWGWVYGTIGIKREDRPRGYKGSTSYYVPSSNTFTSNGGGHTVVPVDENTSLMAFVAPQVTPASSMDLFVEYNKQWNGYEPDMTEAETCALYGEMKGGCELNFFLYRMWEGDKDYHPVYNNYVINGTQTRQPQFYSRVGLLKVDNQGVRVNGQGPIWLAGKEWDVDDDDNITIDGTIVGDGQDGTVKSCHYGDPQLVDLGNDRFLLGYAKFLCSDHGYTANRHMKRSDRVRGGADMLIPQAYYLAEIDADGNMLAGPFELSGAEMGDLGWGGVDEMISLGTGKAGWLYTSTPTKEPQVDSTLPSPRQATWRMMVYESAHVKEYELPPGC